MPPLTSMLNESQVAAELGFASRSALLNTRRLLAKKRIAHFPQPDGTARVEAADLAQYLRSGQPDRDPPRIRGPWFDDQSIAGAARSFEKRLRTAIGELPEVKPAANVIAVRPKATMKTVMSERITEARSLSRRSREDPIKGRLQFARDAFLAVRLRRLAHGAIRRQGIAVANGTAVQKLFSGAAAYVRFTGVAIDALFDGSLTSVSKSYPRTGHPGVHDQVHFIISTADVLNRADLERAAAIAF